MLSPMVADGAEKATNRQPADAPEAIQPACTQAREWYLGLPD